MEFRIADSFTSSLARLTGDEQKGVKNSAFDLQMNPAHPGFQFHRIDKSKDKHLWSVRVGADIRIIVHKTESNFLLCYVDHHDKAYQWAERRRLDVHPRTGAAQFVEIRERIEEIVVPVYVDPPRGNAVLKPALLGIDEEALLRLGVPQEWVSDLLKADDKTLLRLADHLPAEAAKACSNSRRAVSPISANSRFLRLIPSSIPIPCAVFAFSKTWPNWRPRSRIPGKNGFYFCIHPKKKSSKNASRGRRAFRVLREQVKP